MSTGILDASLVDDPTVGLPILEGRRRAWGSKQRLAVLLQGAVRAQERLAGPQLMDTAPFGHELNLVSISKSSTTERGCWATCHLNF
eukprot:SAG31_NODE_784_length_12112_cov_10.538666_7_plen_87_part_00